MKAAIDIGTNTALLLVARVIDRRLEVLHEEQRVPRLGQGVDEANRLSNEAMQRVVAALQEYRQKIADRFSEVETVRVTGTSAVRDATNRQEFLDLVHSKTGFQVEVLSGFEEAQLTFLGAQSVLGEQQTAGQTVIIDIGGGSTEIAAGAGQTVRDRYSYDMGCVRFTERFLKSDPPTTEQLDACHRAIRRMLEEYEFNFVDDSTLIGVAGTVTSLAYIDRNMDSYDAAKLTGHRLSRQQIGQHISRIQKMRSQQLQNRYPEVMKGRGDIFLAGLLILQEFMRKYGFKQLITSTGGIRHGAILNHGQS